MLLTNLAEPYWIQVPCEQPIATHVFCLLEKKKDEHLIEIHADLVLPLKSCIFIKMYCHIFHWHEVGHSLPSKCQNSNLNIFAIQTFQFLFEAVPVTLPPIFTKDMQKIWTCKRYSNVFSYTEHSSHDSSKGLYDCQESELSIQLGMNIFKCQSEVYISYKFLRDDKVDCPDDPPLDEERCESNNTNRDHYSSKHRYLITKNGQRVCSAFYYKSINNTCKKYIFFGNLNKINKPSFPVGLYNCSDNLQVSNILVNDLVADCGPSGEDELLLANLLQFGDPLMCTQPYQLPCREGHPRCYNISEICTFKLNEFNMLMPCRTGEHLQNCSQFKCNMMFKCPTYYCVPWRYVCDGKWDCPHGYDENVKHSCKGKRQCKNMFKCRESEICIPSVNICDGYKDCHLGDDEYLCSLKEINCPLSCECLTFVIRCHNASEMDNSVPIFPHYIIHTEMCTNSFIIELLTNMEILILLFLNYNNLDNFCQILLPLNETVLLDITHNTLTTIKSQCFSYSLKLRFLKLNDNGIQSIEKNSFLYPVYCI